MRFKYTPFIGSLITAAVFTLLAVAILWPIERDHLVRDRAREVSDMAEIITKIGNSPILPPVLLTRMSYEQAKATFDPMLIKSIESFYIFSGDTPVVELGTPLKQASLRAMLAGDAFVEQLKDGSFFVSSSLVFKNQEARILAVSKPFPGFAIENGAIVLRDASLPLRERQGVFLLIFFSALTLSVLGLWIHDSRRGQKLTAQALHDSLVDHDKEGAALLELERVLLDRDEDTYKPFLELLKDMHLLKKSSYATVEDEVRSVELRQSLRRFIRVFSLQNDIHRINPSGIMALDKGLVFKIDEALLWRILNNLLTNAIRHGCFDEPIKIEAAKTLSGVTLKVSNGLRDSRSVALASATWNRRQGLKIVKDCAHSLGTTLSIAVVDNRFEAAFELSNIKKDNEHVLIF